MTNIREESDALHKRSMWPRPINASELIKLKLAIASREEFPLNSDNSFNRVCDEWVEMEEVLNESHVFVLRTNIGDETGDEFVNRIFIVAPIRFTHLQIWRFFKDDLSDLEQDFDTNE